MKYPLHNIALFVIIIIVFLLIKKRTMQTKIGDKAGSIAGKFSLLSVQQLRKDEQGDGHFQSSRAGGARKHNGIDLLAKKGEPVFAPANGKVVKIGRAYADDNNYYSYHIALDNGLSLKLLYCKPTKEVGATVKQGETIGTVQDVAAKYGGGMRNHLHIELRKGAAIIDPTKYFL